MQRLQRAAVEQLMAGRPDTTLEAALEVFEVFASGSLTDEVYILEDVAGKRIAIAPAALKDKYRRGGPWVSSRFHIKWGRAGRRSAWGARDGWGNTSSTRNCFRGRCGRYRPP